MDLRQFSHNRGVVLVHLEVHLIDSGCLYALIAPVEWSCCQSYQVKIGVVNVVEELLHVTEHESVNLINDYEAFPIL